MGQILLIDDEYTSRNSITSILEYYKHEVTSYENVSDALKVIQNELYDLIITAMRLPIKSNSTVDDEGGLKIIQATMDANICVPIIVITGFGSIENAVDAMRLGACDYLIKPIDDDELKMKIQRAIRNRFSFAQKQISKPFSGKLANQQSDSSAYNLENIIGESEAMQQLKGEIRLVSDSTATVLIQGESGTGKELVARALHYSSSRRNKAFITVNCAAVPPSLIEAELFGHCKGSFSSAVADRIGAFEAAEGGTLFLDEIGEMPLEMQPRLLRVLEQKEVKRIGENIAKTVDVRIIAATNKNLEQEVSADRFRPDIFERLNVIVLNLPPLREIKEDIPLLVEHFIRFFDHENANTLSASKAKERLHPGETHRRLLTANVNDNLRQKTTGRGEAVHEVLPPSDAQEVALNAEERQALNKMKEIAHRNAPQFSESPPECLSPQITRMPRISDAALDVLMDYDWPRNIRELKNTIERTLIFMTGDVINENNLRLNTSLCDEILQHEDALSIPIGWSLEKIKLEAIRQTLMAFDGNRTHTAEALDISTSTLWRALKTIKNRQGRKLERWKARKSMFA